MRTHTTNTDISVICRMGREGFSAEEISQATKIMRPQVEHILDVKLAPVAKPKPRKTTKKAAEVDPLS